MEGMKRGLLWHVASRIGLGGFAKQLRPGQCQQRECPGKPGCIPEPMLRWLDTGARSPELCLPLLVPTASGKPLLSARNKPTSDAGLSHQQPRASALPGRDEKHPSATAAFLGFQARLFLDTAGSEQRLGREKTPLLQPSAAHSDIWSLGAGNAAFSSCLCGMRDLESQALLRFHAAPSTVEDWESHQIPAWLWASPSLQARWVLVFPASACLGPGSCRGGLVHREHLALR